MTTGACVAAGFPIFKRNTGSTLIIVFMLLAAFGVIVDLTLRHAGIESGALGYPICMPLLYQYVWGYLVLNLLSACLIAYLSNPSPFSTMQMVSATFFEKYSSAHAVPGLVTMKALAIFSRAWPARSR